MEQGFIKANSSNLPRIDLLMLGGFFASNNDFCSAEFRNVKTSISSRPSYGDDAVSYVHLKRSGNMCTVRGKICPEHKVHARLYAVTVIVDEEEEAVISVQCNDCVASKGGCKHAIAFLMWIHRRSEQPSCTAVECYWIKSKLSRVGTSLKYMTAKDLSNGAPSLLSNSKVLDKFLDIGRKRNIDNCELLKYQPSYIYNNIKSLSMHQLMLKYKEQSYETFLKKIVLSNQTIAQIEEETREQHQNSLWFELRYGRITASKAFEFSRCKKNDGSLIALIMGGTIPDTPAMKHGRLLEGEVRKTVSIKLGKKIRKCGLMLSKEYPMIAGSPDGICEDAVIEIKCPTSVKSYKNYLNNGKPTDKCNAQIQMQMHLTGLQKGYFCVADSNFSVNKNVEIVSVKFDATYMSDFLKLLAGLWKEKIYPILYESTL
ncbi:uncharacterized protein LOC124543737 [Vanessa cardui]|uniref:uncharacterized protein LOC124531295 n=1 Tax=Vanessa cardui TaxID=171605 RepID=UPI001F1352EA|nr:uncharacterized protein LOC124531295 [Vanessa cardui]XP_046977971.1 uncharacterized protein LOC124543737 [Vanessa cardui]